MSLGMSLATHVMAQSETSPPELTAERAKAFLTAAGLQTCEITEMDPMVSRVHGATKSLSIGVAKDCAHYDPTNPTVVNVHQFADQQRRDAMVASLREPAVQGAHDLTATSGRSKVLSSSCLARSATRLKR